MHLYEIPAAALLGAFDVSSLIAPPTSYKKSAVVKTCVLSLQHRTSSLLGEVKARCAAEKVMRIRTGLVIVLLQISLFCLKEIQGNMASKLKFVLKKLHKNSIGKNVLKHNLWSK